MYIYTDFVRLNDVNLKGNLHESGLLKMLQEAGSYANDSIIPLVSDINYSSYRWLVLNWRVKILHPAPLKSKLIIKTWTYFQKNLYSIRNYEVYLDEKLVAIADSKWVCVDIATHSIKKISDELIELFKNETRSLFDSTFSNKFKFNEDLEETFSYSPMIRDLDINNHVNNVSYVEIAKEALPKEIQNITFNYVEVLYKKEIKYNDHISFYYEKSDDNHIVYIYTKDTKTLNSVLLFKE